MSIKRIVTISREFGSGGRYLGEEIAHRLGVPFYDKEIIAKVAEETGLSRQYIEEKGEYSPVKNIFAYAFVGRDRTGASLDDYMYSIQRKVILEVAESGPCVIVGRCADYILRDRTDCLNTFICGNIENKVKRTTELYSISEADARKLIKETDKKRSIHYKYYTDLEWGNAKNYTLSLNSSDIGYDKCMDIICDLAAV